MPGVYQIVGDNKKLKDLCDNKQDGAACYNYALYLKQKTQDPAQKVIYYKKSCDYHNTSGCNAYREYLGSLPKTEVVNLCQNSEYQNCFQGGQVLYDKGELEEALPLLEKACKLDFESLACELRDEIHQELNQEAAD